MRLLLRAIDSINEGVGKVASPLVVLMAALIGIEVVLRYCFNSPTVWAHETTQYIYGTFIILSGGYVLLHKGHVPMDLLYNRLSPRKRALVDVITAMLFFFFCVLLVWKGGVMAWKAISNLEHSRTVWSPPLYPIKAMIPIGATLLLIQGLAKFIRDLGHLITGKELS